MSKSDNYPGYDTEIAAELITDAAITGEAYWASHPELRDSPKCPTCGGKTKYKAGGVSKAGNKYEAFWSCERYPECRGAVGVSKKPDYDL